MDIAALSKTPRSVIMYSVYVDYAKSKDEKVVSIAVQTKANFDTVLINNIKKYVSKNFDVAIAISNKSILQQLVQLQDSNDKTRNFIACFIMNFDADYKNILDAKLISFIEQ